MNIDVEVDRILVQADVLVPDYSPELLGVVKLPQYTLYVRWGWHPERGALAECGSEETFQGFPPHVSCGYGCGCKTLPCLMHQY